MSDLGSRPQLADLLRRSGFAKIAELSDALSEFPLLHARPIWYVESTGTQVRTATVTLVRFGDSYLALTANHIIETFQASLLADPTAMCGVYSTPIDIQACLREGSRDLDIAILDLTHHVTAGSISASSFYTPPVWPPAEISTEDAVSFGGFPGVWSEQLQASHLRFYSFSSGAGEVTSVGERHVYTRLRLDECITAIRDGKVIGSLGGLSGSPVWVWRKLHAELVGMVVEYEPRNDLLYIRRTAVLDPAGRLLASMS